MFLVVVVVVVVVLVLVLVLASLCLSLSVCDAQKSKFVNLFSVASAFEGFSARDAAAKKTRKTTQKARASKKHFKTRIAMSSSVHIVGRLLRRNSSAGAFTRSLSSSFSSSFSFSSSTSSSSSSSTPTKTTTTTKSEKDEESSFLENLIRESNASFPNLEGKVVSGIVTKIDSRNGFIDVDVGFKMPSSFVKEELPEDVKLGDRVPLRVKRLQNPFGEMDVDSVSVDQYRKHQLAWDAIARKRENRELVTGRVLNAVNGGFAVGVSGHVGFLPKNLARDAKGRRLGHDRDATPPIGEAMQFRVLSMTEAGGARNFVVSGPEVETKRQSNFTSNSNHNRARPATGTGKVRTWDGTK